MNPPHPQEADARVVTMLTTEHFALQGARSATTSEALGRATLYLTFISSSLVALSLLGTASHLGTPFVITGLVLAPPLLFLGLVTFRRVLDSNLENTLYAFGINRLRHAYLEIAPEWRRYFIESDHDDTPAVLTNEGLTTQGRFQMFFSSAAAIGVINSVLAGSFVGGLSATLRLGVVWTVVLAAVIFLGVVVAHLRYQERAWANFGKRYPPMFPSRER